MNKNIKQKNFPQKYTEKIKWLHLYYLRQRQSSPPSTIIAQDMAAQQGCIPQTPFPQGMAMGLSSHGQNESETKCGVTRLGFKTWTEHFCLSVSWGKDNTERTNHTLAYGGKTGEKKSVSLNDKLRQDCPPTKPFTSRQLCSWRHPLAALSHTS